MPLDHACGNGRATLAERGHDLYETPREAVLSLLSLDRLGYSGRHTPLWEPAAGRGAISRVLREAGYSVHTSDLVDHGGDPLDEVRDFFEVVRAPLGADTIVTNPPFKDAHRFVRHALALCPRVVCLLRLAFLESDRRSDILDGGNLAEVFVYRKRLPMMHRDGWEGRKANSGMAFAWFVWDRAHHGPATLRRISWDR